MPHRLAIVDDRPQNIHSLSEKLGATGEAVVLFSAPNGEAFLQELSARSGERLPEVVLMDIDMPRMNGIEAVRGGIALHSGIHYLMLTVFDDDDKLFEAIQAGAGGYLLKEESVDTILQAIRAVVEQSGAPMSPRIARKTLQLLKGVPSGGGPQAASNLSQREKEVLQELVAGGSYRQIADKLFVSPNTIRKHIANIYEKLQVGGRAQAVKLAVKNRWI